MSDVQRQIASALQGGTAAHKVMPDNSWLVKQMYNPNARGFMHMMGQMRDARLANGFTGGTPGGAGGAQPALPPQAAPQAQPMAPPPQFGGGGGDQGFRFQPQHVGAFGQMPTFAPIPPMSGPPPIGRRR